MIETITRFLNKLSDQRDANQLRPVLEAVADTISTTSHMSAGLVIKAGGSALVKTGAAIWHGLAKGTRVVLPAATDMAAFAGTVVNTKFNVFAHFVDSAAALTTVMGVEAATEAAVVFPVRPLGKILIGYTKINVTGTGNFVGGTTALDDATVAPNAVHVSVVGGYDPTVKI
jgi:hypothetical protein